MKANLENSVYLKPKLINGQPFVEVTIFKGATPIDGAFRINSDRAVDQTNIRITENETLFNVIRNWLYD